MKFRHALLLAVLLIVMALIIGTLLALLAMAPSWLQAGVTVVGGILVIALSVDMIANGP